MSVLILKSEHPRKPEPGTAIVVMDPEIAAERITDALRKLLREQMLRGTLSRSAPYKIR